MTHRPDPDDAALERALRTSRVLDDAPEALIQRAIDLWQPRPRADAAPGVLRRLVATLSFDSATLAPEAAGVRAAPLAGVAKPRQLLFTADGRDVDLRLEPAADGRHWQVSGQVLGPDEQGGALLRGADGSVAEAVWNALAEFRFDAVAPGPCTLTLRTAEWELELPPLELGG
jgi:hypothetical protein